MITKTKIKVAVADDQALFRKGFISLLHTIDKIDVVVEATNGKELVEAISKTEVDLVFVDFRMPEMNGLSAVKILRKKYPFLKILMLSLYKDVEFVISAMENGANGYLTKDDDPEEIYKAISSVLSIGYYANDRTSALMINSLMSTGIIVPEFKKSVDEVEFTESEIVVMRLIAKELSSKEIALKMCRSERTIESIRASIMEKTGAKNVVGIIMFAIKSKIIEF